MPPSKGSSVSNEVTERRLRPIYDFLDNGFPKKALQEADKVLKKSPNLPCALALKAIALIRVSKPEDAERILVELNKISPTDESTLQAMTLCYTELNRMEMISKIYENATKSAPGSEELLSSLFMAYVRLPDHYKQQHTTAMSLYKANPKHPYYFWSIMSLYLQAIYLDSPQVADKMTLPLAQKLMERNFDSIATDSEPKLMLFSMILERRKDFQKLREFLNGPDGDKMNSYCGQLALKRIRADIALDDYSSAFSRITDYIATNPDDYDAFMYLADTAFRLSETYKEDDSENPLLKMAQFVVDKCNDLVGEMTNLSTSDKRRVTFRAPWMARIEIVSRLQTSGHSQYAALMFKSANSDSISGLFVSYYKKFSYKPVCLMDLTYLWDKCFPHLHELVDQIETQLTVIKNELVVGTPFDGANEMQRLSVYHAFLTYIGHYDKLHPERRIELAVELIRNYEAAKRICESVKSGEGSVEHQARDSFALLAAYHLIAANPSDDRLVLRSIWLLARALNISRQNHKLSIFLQLLYSRVGASMTAYHLYRALDIKHVQLDTISHVMNASLLGAGLWAVIGQQLEMQSRFYNSCLRNVLEQLVGCYRYGSFDKIVEIIDMRNVLLQSIQNVYTSMSRASSFLLSSTSSDSLMTVIDNLDFEKEIDWSALKSRRDFRLFPPIQHAHVSSWPKVEEDLFVDDVQWLRIRHAILNAQYSAREICRFDHSTQTTNGNDHANGTPRDKPNADPSKVLEESARILSEMSLRTKASADSIVNGPLPSLIDEYKSNTYHLPLFNAHLSFLVRSNKLLCAFNSNSEPECLSLLADWESTVANLSRITAQLVDNISANNPTTSTLLGLRPQLVSLSLGVETFSICLNLFVLAIECIRPVVGSTRKKTKKKLVTIPLDGIKDSTVTLINDYREIAEKRLPDLVSRFLSHSQEILKMSQSDSLPVISQLLEDTSCPVDEKALDTVVESISQSHAHSCRLLNDILTDKVRFIKSLNL